MPSHAHRYLAFDFGAESGRAILATLTMETSPAHPAPTPPGMPPSAGMSPPLPTLTLHELHRFPTHNGRLQGTLQWNLLALWEDVKTGLRAAARELKGQPLDGIGVDTWGVDFGLLDNRGQLLANPVHYRDARTDGHLEKVFAKLPRDKVFAATGIQFMQLNTLFQLHALQEQDPNLLARAAHLLFMPDLFHYLLSGTIANELTIASTSQMLDPHTRTWNKQLLDALRIPHHFLGKIIPPGTNVGTLLPDLAKETGLSPNTPIIAPGGHDTASAVAAVPLSSNNKSWCYLSSGTWSLMGVESPDPVVNEQTLKLNYTNEQGADDKVRLLKNIMGLWLVQETRRDLQRHDRDYSYAELTSLASAEPPLRTILNTWDPRFASPGDFLAKIRAYATETHQTIPATPGAFVRACLDSLALAYRLVLGNLETLTSRRIDTIHIVGGGTQNELLNQLTADACQRTVFAGPIEATALGNVIIQALATHTIPTLAKGREIIANSFPLKTYAPQNTDLYANASKLFETLATP